MNIYLLISGSMLVGWCLRGARDRYREGSMVRRALAAGAREKAVGIRESKIAARERDCWDVQKAYGDLKSSIRAWIEGATDELHRHGFELPPLPAAIAKLLG